MEIVNEGFDLINRPWSLDVQRRLVETVFNLLELKLVLAHFINQW